MKFSRSTEKGTLFSRFGPIFNADAFAPRVNVEALLAQKADERHIELAGQRDREAAGGRHAHTMGILATRHFCMISKLERPLTIRM